MQQVERENCVELSAFQRKSRSWKDSTSGHFSRSVQMLRDSFSGACAFFRLVANGRAHVYVFCERC